ncbi:hypothetical protein ES703_34337 [subsurface metagenome]
MSVPVKHKKLYQLQLKIAEKIAFILIERAWIPAFAGMTSHIFKLDAIVAHQADYASPVRKSRARKNVRQKGGVSNGASTILASC